MSTDYESVGDIRYNPWASEVAAPIEQDLRLFEFPEDVETALRNAEILRAQAEDRSGIITNPIIAARKELSDLPEFDILSQYEYRAVHISPRDSLPQLNHTSYFSNR